MVAFENNNNLDFVENAFNMSNDKSISITSELDTDYHVRI